MKYRYNEDAYDEVVRDGQSVRVPLALMDSTQRAIAADNHRPRYAELTDELRQLRERTRASYLRNLSDAWRTVGRDQDIEPDVDDPDDDDQTRRARAYLDFKQRLGNAWKSGRTVVGPGPTVVGAGPSVVGPGPTRSSRDAQSIRDAAWTQYCDRLSNAWRGGR